MQRHCQFAEEVAMRLRSVETTPNPNSMKLNMVEPLGAAVTYTVENRAGCPNLVGELLEIAGLQSVFVCNDFLTLNKDPRADWREILEKATLLLGGETSDGETLQAQRKAAEKEGQTQVLVQTFRGIPIQIKIVDAEGETRISLGDRFNKAAQFVQAETGADYLKERYWADHGVRYGPREAVANEVAEEVQGTFDESTLEKAQAQALGKAQVINTSIDILKKWLHDEDWHKRLKAVQELSPSEDSLSLIALALKDSNPQVRRLAAAALGATGSVKAVEPLCDALLNDQSVGVRRTAGDALSDIGNPAAQPAVCRALVDSNKLVRWRAARFLSDVGTQEALPYLEQAANDPEFEVRLEIESAMQRIRGGSEGLGPAWKRIVEQGI
jgi:hypothetical protein